VRTAIILVLGLVFLAAPAPVWSQDLASGPKAGDTVPALKVYAVVGMQENKEVDYAAERKDKPTIYVFVKSKEGGVPEGGRPAGRFMKELDKVVKDASADAYIVAVWLTDAQEKTKEYLPRIQMSLKFENTGLTYFQGELKGPDDWGVNIDAHVTVVVAAKGKVVASFGYMSLNETDVPKVQEALKKATDGK
jgi:hypothetical protein